MVILRGRQFFFQHRKNPHFGHRREIAGAVSFLHRLCDRSFHADLFPDQHFHRIDAVHLKSRHLTAEHIVVGRRDADRGDAEGVDLLPGNSPAVKGIFDVQLRCKHIGAFIVVVGVAADFPARAKNPPIAQRINKAWKHMHPGSVDHVCAGRFQMFADFDDLSAVNQQIRGAYLSPAVMNTAVF